MADMIAIIRPFGRLDIRPRPSLPDKAPTQPPQGPGLVTWGSAGNSIFELRANLKAEVPKPDWGEQARTYDVIRIKNPDDPDQHVDAEVMTEYQSRNKLSKERMVLRFAKPEASENVEILSRGNTRTSTDV